MDIHDFFRTIRSINPDADYTNISRRIILHTPRSTSPAGAVWRFFAQTFQLGSAVALTAALLFLVVGGFTVGNFFFSPAQLSSLDLGSLRAEAEAIDIQIKLARLQYLEAQTPASGSVLFAEQTNPAPASRKKPSPENSANASDTAEAAPITIDQALELLILQ